MLIDLGITRRPLADDLASLYNIDESKLNLNSTFQDIISKNRFNLIIHPKSNGHGREWELNNYAKLIDKLDDKIFKIFITGSSAEETYIQQIIDSLQKPKNIINLAGKTTIEKFSTINKKSR